MVAERGKEEEMGGGRTAESTPQPPPWVVAGEGGRLKEALGGIGWCPLGMKFPGESKVIIGEGERGIQ